MHLLMRRKLAHSVNAFLVTLLLAGLYSLVYVADVTPHRTEKTNRFLVAGQVRDQRMPGICWQRQASTALEQVISAG
jgi:hypothetical protein